MNKEQSVMILVDQIPSQKIYLVTISMSYPDVVIACIEHVRCLWKHSRAIEAALVGDNMKVIPWVVDWSP